MAIGSIHSSAPQNFFSYKKIDARQVIYALALVSIIAYLVRKFLTYYPIATSTPFYSRIFKDRKCPCINEQYPPQFEKYAQGLMLFSKEILPAHWAEARQITLTFSHRDNVFFTQMETLKHSTFDVFLQNMPYGEKVIARFTHQDQKFEIPFIVDRVRGVYKITKEQIEVKVASTSLKPFREPGPLSCMGWYGVSIDEGYCETLNKEERLVHNRRKAEDPEQLWFFDNQSDSVWIKLFEVNNSKGHDDLDFISITIPFVLPPHSTKGISKEFLVQGWHEAYRIVKGEPFPGQPPLKLRYIQQDFVKV